MSLILQPPTLALKDQALDYKAEHLAHGETVLHGGALLDAMDYEDWLRLANENADPATVHPNWVQASTFFVVRSDDDRIVGMVDIRHTLNDFLASYGGHIGYGVRPSERQKGYATEILRMALDYARSIGLRRVMLACNQDNEGSRRTILRQGGVLERRFLHTDGKLVEVYWIDL